MKTPMKAIRAMCVSCSGGSTHEPKYCQVFDCPLWPFRTGRRPETLAKKNPELLDPEHVRKLAYQKCAAELKSEGSYAPEFQKLWGDEG